MFGAADNTTSTVDLDGGETRAFPLLVPILVGDVGEFPLNGYAIDHWVEVIEGLGVE